MTVSISPPIVLQGSPGKPVVSTAEVEDDPPVRYVLFPQAPQLGQMAVACTGTPMESILAIANPPTPQPWVPVSVPAWALSAVLDSRGKLDGLNLAIDGLSEPTRTRVRWLFDRGEYFERDGEIVNGLGAAIGYTPDQVDQLFRDSYVYANA